MDYFRNIEYVDFTQGIVRNYSESNLCLKCRGAKLLCGKAYCPVIVQIITSSRKKLYLNIKEFYGSSPPSIFIGRVGYPNVYVGPMAPPSVGDTSIYDYPENWINKKIEDIIDFRLSLVRGKIKTSTYTARNPEKLILNIQEIAMSSVPVDIELEFSKNPRGVFLDENTPPFGPSAPLSNLKVAGNIKVDKRIEKVYYDHHLKAQNAVIKLYTEGAPISRIQKALSAGLIGSLRFRRFIPTRWSITAIDDIISLNAIKKIREMPTINKYHVYIRKTAKNIFIALLIPEKWSYEWIEAWFPNTTWNTSNVKPEIMGSYEGYMGRKTYAEIGGCYYASRLALTEKLLALRRQASVLILREIHPGFTLPLGVWFVRENVRAMFNSKPLRFNTLKNALKYIEDNLTIPLKEWISKSRLLKRTLYQEKLKW